MPQEDRPIAALKDKAVRHMQLAEQALESTELGEMERQIEQCRLMEIAYSLLQQVAILDDDPKLLKESIAAAAKWATNMRAATTKRRNDEVPRLIRAMENRKAWARELLGIEEEG